MKIEIRRLKTIFNVLIFICLLVNAKAQTLHQEAYWIRVLAKIKLDSNWTFQAEADGRRSILPDKYLQFISHAQIHRKIGQNTEGSVGVSFSNNQQNVINVSEYRLFQEFYFFQKLTPKIRLTHRLRTEERWFENVENGAIVAGFNFRFRWRYRPQLTLKLTEKWSLKTNTEIMYHVDKYDQFRFSLSGEYRFNPKISLETGYLKVHQARSSGGFTDRDILRTTLYFNF